MSETDALPATPGPSWRERRVSPRHAPVWVRVHGAWRKGTITEWVTDRGGSPGRECAIAADGPQDLPWQGRYVYDPLAIRPAMERPRRDAGSRPRWLRLAGRLRRIPEGVETLGYLRDTLGRSPQP